MKALVLAGGLPQIALINDLKQRGFFTILADYNENPVAKDYADKFYQVSTLDVDAITRIAKEEKVDFLITVCTDQALLTVAKVSETLELPSYVDPPPIWPVWNCSRGSQTASWSGAGTKRCAPRGRWPPPIRRSFHGDTS